MQFLQNESFERLATAIVVTATTFVKAIMFSSCLANHNVKNVLLFLLFYYVLHLAGLCTGAIFNRNSSKIFK